MFRNERINEEITRIVCPGNVFVYLVEGKNKAILIDTGLGIYDLKGYVETLTSKPLEVILTHGHLDHAGGAGQFKKVYLNSLDLDMARVHTEINIRKDYLLQNNVVADDKDMIEKKDVSAYLPLEKEQSFDLGDCTVTALPMPGHTQGSMAILVNRTVLFGDACNSLGFMQFDNCLSIHDYKLALQDFKKKYENRYDTILYSHPHNYGSKEILDQSIALCEEIEQGKADDIPFGPGVVVAKSIDPTTFKRLDGKIANVVYNPLHIK